MGQRSARNSLFSFCLLEHNKTTAAAWEHYNGSAAAPTPRRFFVVYRDAQDHKCRRSHLEPFWGAFVFRQGFILPKAEKAIVGHSVRSKTKIQKIKISFRKVGGEAAIFLKRFLFNLSFFLYKDSVFEKEQMVRVARTNSAGKKNKWCG